VVFVCLIVYCLFQCLARGGKIKPKMIEEEGENKFPHGLRNKFLFYLLEASSSYRRGRLGLNEGETSRSFSL
jgi:hypothetical protein